VSPDFSPLFSVVVALEPGQATRLRETLDSLKRQEATQWEAILVACDSEIEKVQALLPSYPFLRRVYLSPQSSRAALWRKGAHWCEGKYIQFLLAGDLYLSPRSLSWMEGLLKEGGYPMLLQSGRLLRPTTGSQKFDYTNLDLPLLRKGLLLPSGSFCWISRSAYLGSGGLDATLTSQQVLLDLLCRLLRGAHTEESSRFLRRCVMDLHPYPLPPPQVLRSVYEMLIVMVRHFGRWRGTLSWLRYHSRHFLAWSGRSLLAALRSRIRG